MTEAESLRAALDVLEANASTHREHTQRIAISSEDWRFLSGYESALKDLRVFADDQRAPTPPTEGLTDYELAVYRMRSGGRDPATSPTEGLEYALSMLRKAEAVMDHTTVEWAEVATAVDYIGHIVAGRAVDLADAARVEHERFAATHAATPPAATALDET